MIKSTGELLIYRMREIATCNKEKLTDLNQIEIDKDLPVVERVRHYINQVGNPYLFKVGGTAVKVEFGEQSELTDSISRILCAE